MAIITSAAAGGSFTSGASWVGGVAPGVNDDAVMAHSLTFDAADINCKTITRTGSAINLSLSGMAVGYRSINADLVHGGGGSTMVTNAAPTGILTVNGKVQGQNATSVGTTLACTSTSSTVINGEVLNSGSGANGGTPISVSATSSLTVNGNVTVGEGNCGINTGSATPNITINGSVYGGRGSGITGTGAAIISVSGDVAAGANVNGYGIYNTGAGVVVSVAGTVTANTFANGVYTPNATTPVRCRYQVDGSTGKCAVVSLARVVFAGVENSITVRDDSGSPAGVEITLTNRLVGTPDPADVRLATEYGPAAGPVVGTLAVPLPSQVSIGIATDDTTGTAALLMADVVAAINASQVDLEASLATATASTAASITETEDALTAHVTGRTSFVVATTQEMLS